MYTNYLLAEKDIVVEIYSLNWAKSVIEALYGY